MKNKFVLAFLLLPVIIGCQTTTIIQNSSSPTPTPRIVMSASSNVISPISPTIIPISTISPIITNPTPTNVTETNKTPIIESNMFEYIVETPRPSYSPEKIKQYLDKYSYTRSLTNSQIEDIGTVTGFVKDEKGNPVSGANVTLRNVQYVNFTSFGYDYIKTTKTSNDGYYKLNFPIMEPVSITASSDNYITRYMETNPNDGSIGGNRDGILDLILTKSPEIQFVKINNNVLTPYSLNIGREKLSIIYKNGIYSDYKTEEDIPEHEIERFKMQSTNFIKVDLTFNNPIDRISLEKNIFIKKINKDNLNLNNLSFQWSDDNKMVVIKADIKNSNEDIKYRLGFENSFIDNQKNTVFKKRYFALNRNFLFYYTEISESIVFEIAGK